MTHLNNIIITFEKNLSNTKGLMAVFKTRWKFTQTAGLVTLKSYLSSCKVTFPNYNATFSRRITR